MRIYRIISVRPEAATVVYAEIHHLEGDSPAVAVQLLQQIRDDIDPSAYIEVK